jgi:hypothetical protein
LSERERLALIGILIEFPTYYSVILLPSINKSSSITPVQYPLGPEATFQYISPVFLNLQQIAFKPIMKTSSLVLSIDQGI